jgi:F-type H+-transporting ATPase subunit b
VNHVTVTFQGGGGFRVAVDGIDATARQVSQAGEEEPVEGPSPIAVEGKELFWAGGAFLVFLALMRLFLVPRVKQGMDARYKLIRTDLEEADDTRAAARQELAEYQAEVAKVRAEATTRIDAARHQLEGERSERLAEVNGQLAEQRAQAVAEAEAAKQAARQTIDEAVGNVVNRLVELSTGKQPDAEVVRRAQTEVDAVGVTR